MVASDEGVSGAVGTGVNSVKLTLNGKKSGIDATETVNATEGSDSWNYRLPLGEWDEGNLTVTATVTDKAGNEAASSAIFKIDQNKPTIEPITVKVGGSTRK